MSAAPPGLRYGWYGDDFTGATDTLAAVAAAGLRAMLFLHVPDAAERAAAEAAMGGPLDAIGIAGAARSLPPAAMRIALEPVGRFFAAQAAAVLHYKCCSTFDSAPERGSLGAAIACLRRFAPSMLLPVLGGQPNIGRYCAFSTLFAAAGAGGPVHRLDRHPTMATHPVTPMHEADLRRHLALQGLEGVAGLHAPWFERGLEPVADAVAALTAAAPAVLFDVMRPSDLAVIGAVIRRYAARDPVLAVGPSSVAEAVLGTAAHPANPALPPAPGPVLALVGSLSPVSRAQVAAAPSYTMIELDDPGQALARTTALLHAGRSVMVCTGPRATGPAGPMAAATARFLAEAARAARPARIGIAGGDTSSHAAAALGGWGLSHSQTLQPGVALCRLHGGALDGTPLMLKGGQMGSPDLFERLLHGQPGD